MLAEHCGSRQSNDRLVGSSFSFRLSRIRPAELQVLFVYATSAADPQSIVCFLSRSIATRIAAGVYVHPLQLQAVLRTACFADICGVVLNGPM